MLVICFEMHKQDGVMDGCLSRTHTDAHTSRLSNPFSSSHLPTLPRLGQSLPIPCMSQKQLLNKRVMRKNSATRALNKPSIF